MPLNADLENRFTHHAPNAERIRNHEGIREGALLFAKLVLACVPAGREQALALTKLEEAMFWANAGIARAPK